MGDMEGKFLILYYKCEGTIEVANITKDGRSSSTLTIVIVVVMIVVSLGFFYFIYYKKKKKQNDNIDEVAYDENGQNFNNQKPDNFSNNVMINNNN